MKILIADDTPTQLLLVRKHIERLGHQCITAANGAQALALFRSESPDLVLMDVIMPDMDGYTVTRAIREIEADQSWTPVIFLTGMNSEEDLKAGIDAGGDDYLAKPFSPMVLAAKIKAMARLYGMRMELARTTQALSDANQVLTRLTAIDGLTGVANRRRFDEALRIEWLSAARESSALSLLMIDIDHFKAFNDGYGHLAGDDCLRRVAATIQQALCRPADLLARYGGEEFAVLLPGTPASGALQVARQVCQNVRELNLCHKHNPAKPLTVSVGACTVMPDHGGDEQTLVSLADEQLFLAKRAGRDQVMTCGTCPPCATPLRQPAARV